MSARSETLRRELGVVGATMMGLGSIVGTGIFVSVGVAAGAAGPAVILAVVLAAGVATCNAFSSAQLAAVHPVSGGTYEYGYEFLHPALGFTAGWTFLCAKSASAATAALGFAGYLLHLLGIEAGVSLTAVAVGGVVVLTAVVATGMRRSNVTNIAVVSVTLVALMALVVAGAVPLVEAGTEHLRPFFDAPGEGAWSDGRGLLYATALMFVAYTGYGRVATLAEEVEDPSRTIPRAIIATLVVTALLYVAVATVSVGTVGSDALARATDGRAAPLEVVARRLAVPGLPTLVAVGAVTAMLGVTLNLILGLSRVMLAMGRRKDLPRATARLDADGTTPWVAVLVSGALIAGLAATGDVETTWSFSAFTVLVYYAITNLAALQLDEEQRLFSRFFPWAGLVGCLFLAFWVRPAVWLTGLGLIAAGLSWYVFRQRG
jgi:APA family basic amino acid/polyamine antiporter